MDQILDPETDIKHQFLNPESVRKCQFLVKKIQIQKVMLWISF